MAHHYIIIVCVCVCFLLRNVFWSDQIGSVALGIAAEEGQVDAAQRLLEAGATVNQQNKVTYVCTKVNTKIVSCVPVKVNW